MTDYQQLLNDAASKVVQEGIPNVAAVLVRDQGQTVLGTAQGVRDVRQPASLPSNHVDLSDYFAVGSVSKPIFGMLLAGLINQGLLDWTTTIGEVFPEFASPAFQKWCGMENTAANFLGTQVYELTGHVSGFDGRFYFAQGSDPTDPNNYMVTDPFRFISDWTVMTGGDASDGGNARGVEWQNLPSVVYRRYLYTVLSLKQPKFIYNYDYDYHYNNVYSTGYGSSAVIAAAMCERRAGKAFEQLMNELTTTTIPMEILYGPPPNGMQAHTWDGGKFVVWMAGKEPFISGPFAPFGPAFLTGAISCSAQGMAQFIQYNLNALANPAMFDLAAYHKEVMTATPTGAPKATGVAQGGLGYSPGPPGNESYWFNGELPGFYARMDVYPSAGYGWAVMANANGGGVQAALDQLFNDIQQINAS